MKTVNWSELTNIIYGTEGDWPLTLILVRGIPGSGKSTLAREKIMNDDFFEHYEADMYFEDCNGNYNFDTSKLGNAHTWCQRSTEKDLNSGQSVVVSNTFTTMKELKPYMELADTYKARLIIITSVGNFGSVHNVPEEAIARMKNRWVEVEGEYIYDPNKEDQ